MKTVRFRFVKEGSHYYIEVKKWWGWKVATERICGHGGCYVSRMLFAKKENGVQYLYDKENLKPELLRLIEHPTLKIVDHESHAKRKLVGERKN